MSTPTEHPKTAIVLSGGGSRGAYEVGVILYLRTRLAKLLGSQPPFDIITGTSVGAINAAYLAATAERLGEQAQEMAASYRKLRIEDLISLSPMDFLRAGRMLLGGRAPAPPPGAYRAGGLLNTEGLEHHVVSTIPWRQIRRNLLAGHVRALAVSATHVGSGHTVVFIDSHRAVPNSWSSDPFVRPVRAAIGPRHALASAAIPMLFPAVKIQKAFYVDGGLRQNTPMSPAIRLGADRLLVISLRHQATRESESRKAEEREAAYPKPLFLLGKALNALLLDHTEYDLQRLERLNCILDAGARVFGPRFEDMLGEELTALRGAPIRRIKAVHVRPSADIGELASGFIARGGPSVKSRSARQFLRRLSRSEAAYESDLLSYFLFDGGFAEILIELGFEDARAMEGELLEFFGDPL